MAPAGPRLRARLEGAGERLRPCKESAGSGIQKGSTEIFFERGRESSNVGATSRFDAHTSAAHGVFPVACLREQCRQGVLSERKIPAKESLPLNHTHDVHIASGERCRTEVGEEGRPRDTSSTDNTGTGVPTQQVYLSRGRAFELRECRRVPLPCARLFLRALCRSTGHFRPARSPCAGAGESRRPSFPRVGHW